MAVAVTASAVLHAAALVAVFTLVGPHLERTTPPIVLPVSLVYRPGGGGGSGGAAEAPTPPVPSEPAPAPAAVDESKTPPSIARPKPVAKPKPSPAPAETTAATRIPGDATPNASGTQAAGGGGEGARGGSGFSAASPGYGVNPLPPYPIAARQLGLEGEVLLRVFVAADGRPTNVVVLKSSGHAMLDESAAQTVRTRWRFIPATRNGVPVDDTVQVPIRFRQKEG
ncbi:MAG: TonB family protein [Candidatus Binatia bacterium]